ncbi:MAG: hypothetical protein ACTSRH_14055, partial [Promethearchaeota archaeon]
MNAIAFDKEAAHIELIFQKNGKHAKIIKTISRSSKGTSLRIQFWPDLEKDEVFEGKSGKMDEIIRDFLNFDDQILLNSCFVKQKDLEGFMKVDESKERALIINKLLNLEKISKMLEKFSNELKKKSKIDKILEMKVRNINNHNNIQVIRSQISKLTDFKKEFENILKNQEDLEKLHDSFNKVKDLVENKKEQIIEKKNDLNILEDKKKKFEGYSELRKKHEKLVHEIEIKKEAKQSLLSKLELSKSSLNGVIKELEQIKEKLLETTKLQKELEELNKKLVEYGKWRNLFEESNAINEKLAKLELEIKLKKDSLNSNAIKLKELQDQMCHNLHECLNGVNEKIYELKKLKKSLNMSETKLKELEFKFENLKKLDDSSIKLQTLREQKRKIESCKKALLSIKISEKKLSKIEELLMKFKSLKERFENVDDIRDKKFKFLNKITELENKVKGKKAKLEKYGTQKEQLKKSNSILRLIKKLTPLFLGIAILGLFLGIFFSPAFFTLVLGVPIPFLIKILIKKKLSALTEIDVKEINDLETSIIKHNKDMDALKSELTRLDASERSIRDNLKQVLQEHEISSERELNDKILDLERSKGQEMQIINTNKDFLASLRKELKLELNNMELIEQQEKILEKDLSDCLNESKEISQIFEGEILESSNDLKTLKDTMIEKMDSFKKEIAHNNAKLESTLKILNDLIVKLGLKNLLNKNILDQEINQLNEWYRKIKDEIGEKCEKITSRKEVKDFFNKFPVLNQQLESYIKELEIYEKTNSDLEKLNEQVLTLKTNKEKYVAELPERYQENQETFENDLKKLESNISNIKRKIKENSEYLSNIDQNELKDRKSNFERDIEKINDDIKKTNDIIKNLNNNLVDLEQKFPAQLKSIDGKKLDQKIKLIMNEITKLNTQIRDAQINFLKEYKNLIGSDNSNIEFNSDKIESSLKEQKDKIIEKFEKKYKELAKEFNKITKNNILKDISDFIIELENEIGGLEKEINLNLKEIKKLRVKNKKILKNFNIDDLSDKDLISTFEKIRDEKIIYEEAI